jgi:hypothetical protein
VYADFSLLSMSRQPGSTIRLRDCGVERGNAEGREFCTDELQLTFAVTVDRDMDSVALRISFVVDGRRCAVAVSHPTPLNAHAAAELRLTVVDYQMRVDSAPGDLGCDPPPTTTTTMVAELLDYSEEPRGESVARTAFDHTYRFVNQ